MEFGEKLKELNMTEEEIGRFSTAFKDEKFREMLCEYAEEISNPDNKKRYEEEIKLLEQERGHNIEFIHPEPFRCLRTSVNGQEKCYINICSNEKVGKPSCKSGVSETGQRGHCWSLPHCLHPGRQDMDQKGKKIMIYDVIFHPDTIHMASKSKKFMEIVDGAAIQGIQDGFKVTLDKNNVKYMKVKYKGTPQAPVIRKPIPGYQAKEDPLAVPYPDEKRPTACKTTTKGSSATKPQSFQIQPEKTNKPTEPKYTVKHRSFFDLQDFRCSRDSGRSPRPKEIVVTIDLPLLKSVGDTSLEIKEQNLLLESKNPVYKLELALAYPVDQDKGEAKFNKHSRQLIVTLPVLPSKEVFDFPGAPPAETVTEIQRGDEDGQEEEEGRCEKQIGEGEEKVEGEQEEKRQQKVEGEEGEEKGQGERREEGEEEDEEEKRGGGKCEEEKKGVGDGWKEPKVEDEEEGKGQKSVEEEKEEGEQEEIKQQKIDEEGSVEEEKREDKKCEEKKEVEDKWKEVKMEEEERNVREEEEKEEMKQQKMEVEGGEGGKDKGGEEKEQDEEEKREGKKCEEKKEVEDKWKEVKMEEEEMKQQEMEVEEGEDGKDRGDEEEGKDEEEEEKVEEKEGEEKREGEEYEEAKKEAGGKWKEPKKEEEEREEQGKGQECVEEEEEEEERRSEQQVEDCLKHTREEEDEKESTTQDVQEETEKTDTEKMGTDASFLHQIPSANLPSSHQTHTGGSGWSGLSEEAVMDEDGSAQTADIDEDDLTTEQVFHNLIHEDKPLPVLLREIGEDGSEKIISDHSTSAGFTFQNSLLFELD